MINFKTNTLIIGLILTGSLASQSFAQGGEENFAQAKVMTLKMLDQRMNDLKQTKACVQRAQDASDMKECRIDAKADRKEMRREIKNTRERLKQEQNDRMERKN